MSHYPDLGSAFNWFLSNLPHPVRSTNQILKVTRHQYGISVLVSQTSFRGKTSCGAAKCRLFSWAILNEDHSQQSKLRKAWILIPRCGFRIPGTRVRYLSVELGFWFQLLDGFRIPWAVFRIPQAGALIFIPQQISLGTYRVITIKRLLFVFVFYHKFEAKSFYQLFWTFPFIIPASLRELPEHQENRA